MTTVAIEAVILLITRIACLIAYHICSRASLCVCLIIQIDSYTATPGIFMLSKFDQQIVGQQFTFLQQMK